MAQVKRVAVHGPRTPRHQIRAFVRHLNLRWEFLMGGFSVAYVFLSFRHDKVPGSVPSLVLIGFTALFLAEFSVRLWAAKPRAAYAREHWIDVVACIPFIGAFRILRLVKFLPIIVKAIPLLNRLGKAKGTESFAFLGPTLLVVWMGAAVAIWAMENDASHANVHDFSDALYWSFLTVVTVGNSGLQPISSDERIFLGVLTFLGVGLVGLVSSRLTATLLKQTESDEKLLNKLKDVSAAIERLEARLGSETTGRPESRLPLSSPDVNLAREDPIPAH